MTPHIASEEYCRARHSTCPSPRRPFWQRAGHSPRRRSLVRVVRTCSISKSMPALLIECVSCMHRTSLWLLHQWTSALRHRIDVKRGLSLAGVGICTRTESHALQLIVVQRGIMLRLTSTTEEETNAYGTPHLRIAETVRGLIDEQLAIAVPCCPLRTMMDIVGQLTGVFEDRRDGNMPSGGFGDWTTAQVARHQDEARLFVLDQWNELSALSIVAPPSFALLSFGAVTHEYDLPTRYRG